MLNSNLTAPRQWQKLGNTLLDLAPVVKIEFERSDARLFVVSGEALLMTAWTESRSEILALRQHASEKGGWAIVESDAADAGEADYTDSESRDFESDGIPSGAGDRADEARLAGASPSDHRVCLAAVDRLVSLTLASGPVVDLFASGVFLGRVAGADAIGDLEARLGI